MISSSNNSRQFHFLVLIMQCNMIVKEFIHYSKQKKICTRKNKHTLKYTQFFPKILKKKKIEIFGMVTALDNSTSKGKKKPTKKYPNYLKNIKEKVVNINYKY